MQVYAQHASLNLTQTSALGTSVSGNSVGMVEMISGSGSSAGWSMHVMKGSVAAGVQQVSVLALVQEYEKNGKTLHVCTTGLSKFIQLFIYCHLGHNIPNEMVANYDWLTSYRNWTEFFQTCYCIYHGTLQYGTGLMCHLVKSQGIRVSQLLESFSHSECQFVSLPSYWKWI